jgi:hypothetical protein
MNDKKIAGVVCYWEIVPPPNDKKPDFDWKLVEAYPVDGDGYPLVSPRHTGKLSNRQEWQNWTNRLVDVGEGHQDCESIMGRAVTHWCFGEGVALLEFNPPAWASWLSASFYSHLRENRNWMKILEGSTTLYFGTIEQARKMLSQPPEVGTIKWFHEYRTATGATLEEAKRAALRLKNIDPEQHAASIAEAIELLSKEADEGA